MANDMQSAGAVGEDVYDRQGALHGGRWCPLQRPHMEVETVSGSSSSSSSSGVVVVIAVQ